MQVTPKATPLLLPRQQKPLVRAGQVVPETEGVDGIPRLVGEITQEIDLVGPEPTLAGPNPEDEPPDVIGLVHERDDDRRVLALPALGGHCNDADVIDDLERDDGRRSASATVSTMTG